MSDEMDPGASTIERMLHKRPPQMPPSALRTRVLAAVADVLQDDRCVQPLQPAAEVHWLTVGGLVATALSLLLVATLSRAATSHPVGRAADRPILSFVQRAEVAGIALDMASPTTAYVADHDVNNNGVARPPDILRSIDAHRFLQGEL